MDRIVVRRTAAAVLLALGLGGAFAATHARRLGNGLVAAGVTIGEDPEGAPDPGNAEPFAPFAFGVVGPLRGSHAALGRALAALEAAGGVDLVVLLGDVSGSGSETEFLRLAATWRDAGVERMAVAGAADLDPSRDGRFQEYVSPARWWFVRNGCLFVGVSAGEGDADFVARAARTVTDPHASFGFTTSADVRFAALAPLGVGFDAENLQQGRDAVAVERYQVPAEGAATTIDAVGRGPTLASLRRDVELGFLFPIVRDGWAGLAAVLAACAACVGLALRLLRRRPDAAGRP